MFDRLARVVSDALGRSWTTAAALTIVVVWAAVGPFVRFSNGWQLTINTGTTIVTFLMVFVLQHTQNRDTLAMHTKLDALLRAIPEAPDRLRAIEEAPEREIRAARDESETT